MLISPKSLCRNFSIVLFLGCTEHPKVVSGNVWVQRLAGLTIIQVQFSFIHVLSSFLRFHCQGFSLSYQHTTHTYVQTPSQTSLLSFQKADAFHSMQLFLVFMGEKYVSKTSTLLPTTCKTWIVQSTTILMSVMKPKSTKFNSINSILNNHLHISWNYGPTTMTPGYLCVQT